MFSPNFSYYKIEKKEREKQDILLFLKDSQKNVINY